MAIIGQQLLQPEVGWKRYDDSNVCFLYKGDWITINGGSGTEIYYNKTLHYNSTTTLKTVSFNFTGTKIRVISSMWTLYGGNIEISIDGVKENYSLYSTSTNHNRILVYEKTGLKNKEHTVIISNLGVQGITFDAIDIDESGELLPYREIPLRHLIKSSNKIQVLSEDKTSLVYPNIQEPLTQANYEKWGMDSLVGYENEIDKVLIEMENTGELEDGKVLRKLVNKNEFKINSLGGKVSIDYTENLIPHMTSNTTPSGIVTASSENVQGSPAFFAFNGNLGHNNSWQVSPWTPCWIAYEFPIVKKIEKYTVRSVNYDSQSGGRAPKNWTFEGYDNIEGKWEVLDTRNEEVGWGISERREYTLNNNKQYKKYRINVTSHNGNSWGFGIGLIEMFEAVVRNKHLIKSSNKIQVLSDGNWIDTGLVEPLTKADFEEFGMNDLSIIPSEKWQELDVEFEVIAWTDDTEPKFIEITTDPFSPLCKLNNTTEFEVLTWTDNLEEIPRLELTVPEYKPYRTLDNPSIVTYTESEYVPILSQTVLATSKVRFLVSKDKTNYQVYQGGEWLVVNKSNILEQGMTKVELELIPQEVWGEWFENEAHKNSFNILIGMYSGIPNIPLLRKIEIEFEENEKPIIIDAELVPDDIHNEYAVLNANVKDLEGDKISFKVLIKKAEEEAYTQVSPLEGWYDRSGYEEFITQSFNYPYFNPGDNKIKLLVKDQRGMESEWIGNVLLSNTDPTISIIYDDTQMTATIGDEDGDRVAYRLFINNEMIFDFTEFKDSPTVMNYLFDSSNLEFGVDNDIRLEVKDTHGGLVEEEFTVVGSYRGLMFKNERGEYFVDDKGNILMDLLLQDTVLVGGQTSSTKKVILENRNGFPIKNTTVKALEKEFTPNAWVELSETEMPFTPKDIINISGVMNNLDTKDFYVRVRTERTASQGNYFYINGKASPV